MLRLTLLAAVFLMAAPALPQGQQQAAPLRSRAYHSPHVTFSNQAVRIFQKNCQVCHREGEVAPFPLLEYGDAKTYSQAIANAVRHRRMPPWKPVEGQFRGDRRLLDNELETLLLWAATGALEGDRRLLPKPLVFPRDWTLGEPDLILEMETPYAPDPTGGDDYRCFSLPTGLTEGAKIKALDIQPGNRRIVHHIILFPDPEGHSAALGGGEDPDPGYTCFGGPGFDSTGFLGGWVPGGRPQVLPDGTAVSIAAGSRLVMQVHYSPAGTLQQDQTRVGLYFTEEPATREMTFLPLVNMDFTIPAGAKDYGVTAEFTVPPFIPRARIYSLLPHMHLLGREIKLDVTYVDGSAETLIRIDDWDFHWQDMYWLEEPRLVRPGTRLKLTCVYDNSADNPRNPNSPPQDVGWGERTVDEMALIFIGFTLE